MVQALRNNVMPPTLHVEKPHTALVGTRFDGHRHTISSGRAEETTEADELALQAVRRYEAAGCDLLLCLVNPYKMKHEDVMECIELMGKHVIPAFS